MRVCDTSAVPEGCPSRQAGEIDDLSQVPFRLSIVVDESDTEIFASFGARQASDEDEYPNLVETAPLVVATGSVVAEKVGMLAASYDPVGAESVHASVRSDQDPNVEQMRQVFCKRVMECAGIDGGECWALGGRAVREVIEQTALGN